MQTKNKALHIAEQKGGVCLYTVRRSVDFKQTLNKNKIINYYKILNDTVLSEINIKRYNVTRCISIDHSKLSQTFHSLKELKEKLPAEFLYDYIFIQFDVRTKFLYRSIIHFLISFANKSYSENSITVSIDSENCIESEDLIEVIFSKLLSTSENYPTIEIQTSPIERQYIKSENIKEKHWSLFIGIAGWLIAIIDIILRIIGI